MFLSQTPTTTKLAALSDEELLTLYQQTNDQGYFAELFGRYVHLVYLNCFKYAKRREDARDLVMQIFEKVLRDAPKLKTVHSFRNWLYIIIRNECIDAQRRQCRRRTAVKSFAIFSDELVEFPNLRRLNIISPKEESKDLVEKGLRQLTERQRTCIYLFYYERKSYQEIAEETGFEIRQVKSYLQNGKRRLKLILRQETS